MSYFKYEVTDDNKQWFNILIKSYKFLMIGCVNIFFMNTLIIENIFCIIS
jgi:hypothetical protein